MRMFHLPPTDPRIQRMTLEQRNFCIANMNADINEANGKANAGAFSDTTKNNKWYYEPDYKFDPGAGIDHKKFMASLERLMGPQAIHDQIHAVKVLTGEAGVRHNWRVKTGRKGEQVAMKGLLKKAKSYKKQGIDRSNELEKYYDNQHSGNKYGFDV